MEVRPGEVCFSEVRHGEVRLCEVRPVEVRPFEVRLFEVRLSEVRPFEVRPRADLVHSCDFRVETLRPGGGLAGSGPPEVRLVVRLVEHRPFEVRLCEVRPVEVRPGEVCFSEVRPGEVRLCEVRPGEVRPFEVRLFEVRPFEVRPGEVRQLEVLTRLEVMATCARIVLDSPRTRGSFVSSRLPPVGVPNIDKPVCHLTNEAAAVSTRHIAPADRHSHRIVADWLSLYIKVEFIGSAYRFGEGL